MGAHVYPHTIHDTSHSYALSADLGPDCFLPDVLVGRLGTNWFLCEFGQASLLVAPKWYRSDRNAL